MGQKKSTVSRAKRNAALDVSLQGVMDGIEDKLFIIDKEYRVSFANLAMKEALARKISQEAMYLAMLTMFRLM